MNNLENCRDKLEELNGTLLRTIGERRSLVSEIALLKQAVPVVKGYSNYSPKREWELYKRSLNLLSPLSIKELLAFSLLIEDHAGASRGVYPAWSRLDHLKERESDSILISMTNPLLIALLLPDKFSELSFIEWFQDIQSEIH